MLSRKIKNKTKCGVFSKIRTSIDSVRIIDIDAIGRKLFKSISLPLIRRRFPPELFSQKIVGVQALSAPIGLAYAMRFRDPMESFNELV